MAGKLKNRPVKITRRKHRLLGFIEGTSFTIWVRRYTDKNGKRRMVVAGPGLRDST